MTQIEELQGRILTAMERISAGVSKLEEAHAAAKEEAKVAADTSALEAALEEEKVANAQLEERVKVLHERLQNAGAGPAPAAADAEEMAALQSELELLRNEVGNTDEKDALKIEVARLKGELESVGNGLAAEKEALQTQLAELKDENQQLKEQVQSGGDAGGDDIGSAVDQAALEAELTALKAQLAAAQEAGAQPTAEAALDDETLVRLDAELQTLRQANEKLRASNTALREANAEGVSDAGLINASLSAEVEGLRAAQASDQAQVNAVLAKLEPLLANAQNLPEGEEV